MRISPSLKRLGFFSFNKKINSFFNIGLASFFIFSFFIFSTPVLAIDNCSKLFPRDLKIGSTGTDVKELQKYLNNNGFAITKSGSGAKGNETTYYGTLTKNALAKFQKAKKITPIDGNFGKTTREFLGCTVNKDKNQSSVSKAYSFTRDLKLGSTGTDVKELQKYLNNNGFIISKTGVGSKGNETTYYGTLTKNALAKFQKTNKITPADGIFGKTTRTAINKKISSSNNVNKENSNSSNSKPSITNPNTGTNSSTTFHPTNNYYYIGAKILNISGEVIVRNNGTDPLKIHPGYTQYFFFYQTLKDGSTYNITAESLLTGQTCYVNNATGTVHGSDVDNVEIFCGLNLTINPFINNIGPVSTPTGGGGGGGGGSSTPSPISLTSISAISGTPKVNMTLTAGTPSPVGATVSYQWQSSTSTTGTFSNITSATNSTYTPTSTDVDQYIRLVVTGTGSYTGTVISAVTDIVTAADVIDIAAISGVTVPVSGATPVSTITASAQYTGTVSWSPSASTFASSTVYTATITLTPTSGYTLTGVAENFFTVSGATSVTNSANSGTVTAVFPVTASTTINIAAINGVTVPVAGATPVSIITESTQYTGTVSWSPATTTFGYSTAYTATITLTAKSGYTLTGVAQNFFTVSGADTVTNTASSGIVTAVFPATGALASTTINIAAISGVTVPVSGATPVSTITASAQYTGTVSWSPSASTFASSTVYTATITLTPTSGYTLTGVAENFFTVSGATSVTNSANSGTVTAVFPVTASTTINIAAINGVTVPVAGATPVSIITESTQYTGTVSWSPATTTFGYSTAYTATITLTAKSGYTLTGVAQNFFTVSGADTVTNTASSGIVTAVFPATGALASTTINIAAISGVTVPVSGATPVSTITASAQYTGTVSWSPSDATFNSSTVYTATITIIPKTWFTLSGVSANFFTVSGASSVSNSASSGVITAIFPEAEAQGLTSLSAIWANNGEDKVTQDELRATNNSSSVINANWDGTQILVSGARNEMVEFNLVLEAGDQDVSNINVSLDSLTGPGGYSIGTRTINGGTIADDLFNYEDRNIELFYVRYLQIQGLSRLSYNTYDEDQVPVEFQRPGGVGTWYDRPDHDKYYPDIAVPIELEPSFTVSSSTNQSIWADIYIPKDAPAGEYSGNLTITEGSQPAYNVPVKLHVRNFNLSDEPSGKTVLWGAEQSGEAALPYVGTSWPNYNSSEYELMEIVTNRTDQMAHRHKISFLRSTDMNVNQQTLWPSSTVHDVLDSLTGDLFTSDNNYYGPGQGLGSGIFSIGTYGGANYVITNIAGGSTDEEVQKQAFWDFTDAWVNWLDEHNLSSSTESFLYLIDESTDYTSIEKWATWMDENPGPGHRLKSFATINADSSYVSCPSLDIAATWTVIVDVDASWDEAANYYVNSSDRSLYFYNGYRPEHGSFATEDEGTALVVTSWAQFKKDIDRWFFWDSTYYSTNNVFQKAKTFGGAVETYDSIYGMTSWNYSNGDGLLFYPGTNVAYSADNYEINGPIASLRLKLWRRGVQDIDYLTMAEQIDASSTLAIVNRMVPRVLWEYGYDDNNDGLPDYYEAYDPGDLSWAWFNPTWSVDPDDWSDARDELAAIIEGAQTETVDISAITGVTAPVAGANPVNIITPTAQYEGSVSWSPAVAEFSSSTVYTATITLNPKVGYTLNGVTENFFTVSGATTTNSASSGVVTAVFPATGATVIDIAAINGVNSPTAGATPVSAITESEQYTGAVSWSPSDVVFGTSTVYTATITLSPKEGYTLTGVAQNFFTVSGASSVSNSASSGVITAAFPATGTQIPTTTAYFSWSGTSGEKTFVLQGLSGTSVNVNWGDASSTTYVLLGAGTDVTCTHNYSGSSGTTTFSGDVDHITSVTWSNPIAGFFLSGMSSLQALRVSGGAYGSSITLESISEITTLRSIYIEGSISDHSISALSGLVDLQQLYIPENGITNIAVLSNLPDLNTLALGYNNISVIPDSFPAWTGAALNFSNSGLDSAEVDDVLNKLYTAGANNLTLSIAGSNGTRTSASDTAVNWLRTTGASTVTVNE